LGAARYLIVTADDFGIGPATSQGILELGQAGRVTGAVLLVNSPYAAEAVTAWQRAARPMELGWHPCLSLDRPILPARCVGTLVDADGRFWSLGRFLVRLGSGRISPAEIEAELRAQYLRFIDLVGVPPAAVNAHHHLQVFPPIRSILAALCQGQRPRPYVRHVREPWRLVAQVPGARLKRLFLSMHGRRAARDPCWSGFFCNDFLAGVSSLRHVRDADFFLRWLHRISGKVVELTCHPGHYDPSLIGRDCATEQEVRGRAREWELLQSPRFVEACERAGFTLISASQLQSVAEHLTHAA
jgi:predicted glycoside hydrolase/deacetylase ChbG (UPF0249 family)